jgi:hypothetical protein
MLLDFFHPQLYDPMDRSGRTPEHTSGHASCSKSSRSGIGHSHLVTEKAPSKLLPVGVPDMDIFIGAFTCLSVL